MVLNGDDLPAAAPALDQGSAVAVVGTGAMGSGIAQVAAQAGHVVYLVDAIPGTAQAARDKLSAVLQRLADKGKISAEAAHATTERLRVADGLDQLPEVGLVIEAAREDLATKQDLFATLERTQPTSTVLATNTSSIDTAAIAQGLTHPERLIGLHFFNPPALMRLVEVIHGTHNDNDTSRAVLATCTDLMRAWGKTPVSCTSTPGFIVNRVARPFYGEAQRMVADGANPATIDLAIRNAGFKMGPMELTDLIGQDVNLAVGTSVWEQTGRDPRYAPTEFQRQLVESGRLGRKSGLGIFTYDDTGQAIDAHPDEAIAKSIGAQECSLVNDPLARTLAMIVNEAVDLVDRCEADAADVDTSMRLGTNYPMGPFEWGRKIGFETVSQQLAELDRAFPGGRYRPSPALLQQDS